MLAEAVTLLAQVMDADSVPVARVRLEHAGVSSSAGRRPRPRRWSRRRGAPSQAAGPAGTALQPAVRAFQEKLAAR